MFLRVSSSKPLVQARKAFGAFDPGIILFTLYDSEYNRLHQQQSQADPDHQLEFQFHSFPQVPLPSQINQENLPFNHP